jgi:hypothetical protein
MRSPLLTRCLRSYGTFDVSKRLMTGDCLALVSGVMRIRFTFEVLAALALMATGSVLRPAPASGRSSTVRTSVKSAPATFQVMRGRG